MSRSSFRLKELPIFKILVPVYVCIAIVFALLIKRGHVQLLDPKGYIAEMQSKLLWEVLIFAAIVGAIMISAFFIAVFRYKEGSDKLYEPKKTPSMSVEMAGWWFQLLFIVPISFIVWITAHQVDPFRPISSTIKPITIQVVAMQWKWVFFYPAEHIATVNMIEIPVGTPISFQLTADAPMNSFWIPQLSGQVYAMTGMVNQLHIRADQPGTYRGSPAEISGADFAGMEFNVKVVSPQEFTAWKATSQAAPKSLDYAAYRELGKPSSYVKPAVYKMPDTNLFDITVMKFMVPTNELPATLKKGNDL
jgi:cytochrome o ubiquinol oxidase subunit 2